MAKLPLTLALGYYDHVTDLVTGRVPVEGVDLNCLQMERPAEIFYRFIVYRDFDVSEISLAKYASFCSQGDNPFVAIPVFPSRLPRHSSIYVRRSDDIRVPADLAGRRIGLPEWAETAAVYMRGALAEQYGLDLTSVQWVQAGRSEKVDLKLPPGIKLTSLPHKSLSDMLVAGELDAVIAAHPPQCFEERHPGVTRLFENFVDAEQQYVRETGIFPIMHVVAIRKEILDRNPWLAMNLLLAFEEAKDLSVERALKVRSSFPIPWAYEQARHAQEILGGDIWPYGIEPNRKTLDAFLRYAFEQGVCHRLLQVEDLFAPQVQGRFRT
jgi:4,5-dihydroxyphthalate decarboxylase